VCWWLSFAIPVAVLRYVIKKGSPYWECMAQAYRNNYHTVLISDEYGGLGLDPLEVGNEGKYRVISRWISYHGNTIGALSMSGRTAWRREFTPYLQNFPKIHPPYCYRCPFGKSYPGCGIACAEDLERVITLEGAEGIAAFIDAEHALDPNYARITREKLTAKGWTIVGEFQCKGKSGFLWFDFANKGHPDEKDLQDARTFAKGLLPP
jgi:hypothetical protein